MRRSVGAIRILPWLAFVFAIGIAAVQSHRAAAQANRPNVRLIEIAPATIDDGEKEKFVCAT